MLSRSAFRLAPLVLVLVLALAGAARADAPDWRAALGLSADEAVTSSASDAKRRLAGVPGAEAVVSDADTSYPDGDRPAGRAAAEWHFFPSSRSDSLGPTKELMDELRANGIGWVIHLP